MKKVLMLVTLLIFTLAFGTIGFAVPIPIQVGDLIQFSDHPSPNASVPEGTGGAFFASTPSFTFLTFCLEVTEPLTLYGGYPYKVGGLSTGAIAGGKGGQDPPGGSFDPLDPFSAWLYTQAVNGAYGNDALDDVQYALWYQEGEIDYDFLISRGAQGFYTAELANYVDDVDSGAWSGLGNVRVINVVTKRFGSNRQDVLVEVSPVPEPATMLLLGAGLIGLVGVGRTKLFKRDRGSK
jgi:hypothetical protein